jgi:hypothetical protein
MPVLGNAEKADAPEQKPGALVICRLVSILHLGDGIKCGHGPTGAELHSGEAFEGQEVLQKNHTPW